MTKYYKRLFNYEPVTKEYLVHRLSVLKNAGYNSPKWLDFCMTMIERGYYVRLHEAYKTHSKYVRVNNGNKNFTVRFSDHKPIKWREQRGDCDFFVGITNFNVTTIHDAIKAVEINLPLVMKTL